MFLLIIFVLLVFLFLNCVRIVPQAQAVVVERLGRYHATWDAGIHIMLPILDRVAKRVNLKDAAARDHE